MAEPRRPMDERELAALIDSQIADAKSYEQTDLSSLREKALEYIEGVMHDTPSADGRSEAVSKDVADTLGWIIPSLMRVFLSSDKVVVYEPMQPNDEKFSKQATEYINFLFSRRCDGYRHLRSAIYNGLAHGNGVLMHWWDDTIEHQTHTLQALTQDEFMGLAEQDGTEVLEYSERPDPMAAQPLAANGMGMPGSDPSMSMGSGPGQGPGAGGVLTAPPARTGGTATGGALAVSPTMPTPEMLDPTSFANEAEVMPPEVATQIPTDGGPIPPDVLGQLPALMPPPVPMLVDCKIRVQVRKGRLRLEALAPENFFIAANVEVLDETIPFCAVRYTPMRSDLVRWGYDPDLVDDLPVHYADEQGAGAARNGRDGEAWRYDIMHRAAEKVEVWECYPLVDWNGDGIAERLRVIIADKTGSDGYRRILELSEWEDDLPFTDLVPDPVPHRWRGRSIFDETNDIQRIKTVLLRAYLDNIYWTNNPQRSFVEGMVSPAGMDELMNPSFGGAIAVKQPGAIENLVIPFVADKSLQAMEWMDRVREYRTGVSAATQGLDPDVLQNQTATAVNAAQSAARSKVEEYARNIKEVGLPRFFGQLLRLVAKHQDREDTIRLRDEWVTVDPRVWNSDMDVTINTGLGTGNRERDAMAMQAVMGIQEKIIGALGMDNPICGLEEVANAAAGMAESLNIRSHSQYFRDVNAEDIRAMQEKKQPTPEEQKLQFEQQKAQAEMQLEQQKAQANQQLKLAEITERGKAEQAKARIDVWKAQQAAQIEVQTKQQEAAIRLQTEREKMQFELAKFREQINAEFAIKQQEWQWEFALEKERANTKMTQERTELGGEAG
jgi:hypothetical protein